MQLDFKKGIDNNPNNPKPDPVKVRFVNFIVPSSIDNVLELIQYLISLGVMIGIVFLFIKREMYVWIILDNIISYCFLIYLNFELPLATETFFGFFNFQRLLLK